jgi:hypothetical protein
MLFRLSYNWYWELLLGSVGNGEPFASFECFCIFIFSTLSLHFTVIFCASLHMVCQILSLPRIYFSACLTSGWVVLTFNRTELCSRVYRVLGLGTMTLFHTSRINISLSLGIAKRRTIARCQSSVCEPVCSDLADSLKGLF